MKPANKFYKIKFHKLQQYFFQNANSCTSDRLCISPSFIAGPRVAKPYRLGMDKWNFRHLGVSEACKSCQELIKCACNVDKECSGRSKCVKAWVVPEVHEVNSDNREIADSRTPYTFIRDTACFHCYSMNCDSYFSESQ